MVYAYPHSEELCGLETLSTMIGGLVVGLGLLGSLGET